MRLATSSIIGLLALAGCADRRDPNVLIVVVDGLRHDALSQSAGAPEAPALRRLTADGVTFRACISHAPEQLPAHAAILSGRLPHETGVVADGRPVENVELLADVLSEAGWQTLGISASAALRPPAPGHGLDQGFALFDGGQGADADAELVNARVRRALDSIDPDRPWFLWVQLEVPEEVEAAAEAGPRAQRDNYRRSIEKIDRAVDALMTELRERAEYEDTLIVLTSAHGVALGEHGTSGPASLYDEVVRVPLVVKSPASHPIGAAFEVASRSFARHVDIAPTVLDALHAGALEQSSGRSLLDKQTAAAAAVAATRSGTETGVYAMRDARAKLVYDVESKSYELYDLGRDPLELENRFDREGHLWHDWQVRLEAIATREAAPEDEVQRGAALRARVLGY